MEYNNLLIFIGISLIVIPLIVRYIKKQSEKHFQLLRLKNMAGSISDYEYVIFQKQRAKRIRPRLRIRIKTWSSARKLAIKQFASYNWKLVLSTFKKKEKKKSQTRMVVSTESKYQPPQLITGEDKFTDSGKPLTAPPESKSSEASAK